MQSAAACSRCGAVWSEGAFVADCPECGGGALERSCPACGGLCGNDWTRAVLDSNDTHIAHWIGECGLARRGGGVGWQHAGSSQFEWWLDESALPALCWAGLVQSSMVTVIIDMDGVEHRFATLREARGWLRQDEYEPLSALRQAGQIERDISPPLEIIEKIGRLVQAGGRSPA